MDTTTIERVHVDFANVIRSIVPKFPLHRDDRWKGPVHNVEAVPVPARRTFHMQWELDGDDFVSDGIYGDGVEHECILRVFTSYVGLPEDGLTSTAMIQSDREQLWVLLQDRIDSNVPGLLRVSEPVWNYVGDEPGHIWGAHVFRIRFLSPVF